VDPETVSVMEGGRRPSAISNPHSGPNPYKNWNTKNSNGQARERVASVDEDEEQVENDEDQQSVNPSTRDSSTAGSVTSQSQGSTPVTSPMASPQESPLPSPAKVVAPTPVVSVSATPKKEAGKRITGTWYAVQEEEEDLDNMAGEPVVVYVTSVRAIRKTYDACETVKSIFLNMGVEIDERDISMSIDFRRELKERMGSAVPVPRVFFGDKYLGGYEEVMQMNECEELKVLLQEGGYCKGRAATTMCDKCGNMRFVPCPLCSGSKKLADEDGDLFRCPDCNENGCVRCDLCSSWGAV